MDFKVLAVGDVVGMTPRQGEDILDAGADVITMGNHTFGKRELVDYLDDCPQILRPANLAPQSPGKGWGIFDTKAGPDHVTLQALITWLIKYRSRD